MALFSHFGEGEAGLIENSGLNELATSVALAQQTLQASTLSKSDAALAGKSNLAGSTKRKGKNGNKLSQEEIANLPTEELEKYILNEG